MCRIPGCKVGRLEAVDINQLGMGADLKKKGTRCSKNYTEKVGIGWREGWVKRKGAERVYLNLARYLDESSSGEAGNWAERMRGVPKTAPVARGWSCHVEQSVRSEGTRGDERTSHLSADTEGGFELAVETFHLPLDCGWKEVVLMWEMLSREKVGPRGIGYHGQM